MTVLFIGENNSNDHISEFFMKKGMDPVTLPDVSLLRSLSGEAGNFVAHTKDTDIEASFVILTEQPSSEPPEIGGLKTNSLYSDNKTKSKTRTNTLEPIVFLLDYVCESPMASTIRALKDTADLARIKRRVYYLAKFIRTAGHGIETLYSEARDAGVIFVKYEDLQITTDTNEEVFKIKASDGVLTVDIQTTTIYSDGGLDIGEHFSHAVKKLNLTAKKLGHVTEDTYYLTPTLTSRRGVYHITKDVEAERLNEGLDFICAIELNNIRDIPSHGSAVIDGKKCVFCYNCHRACPHAALEPDTSVNQMQCLPIACAGCGTCASLCPGNAITLETNAFSNTLAPLVGADGNPPAQPPTPPQTNNTPTDHVGTTAPGRPRALVLCCENSAALIIDECLDTLGHEPTGIETITVPCGGLIGMEHLLDGLGKNDKVMSIVCPDDACRHFDGNKRACTQTTRLRVLLEAAGITPERVKFTQISHAMTGILNDELRDFMEG